MVNTRKIRATLDINRCVVVLYTLLLRPQVSYKHLARSQVLWTNDRNAPNKRYKLRTFTLKRRDTTNYFRAAPVW